ncbi:hypothetical protein GUJ93_ZPchr0002g24927 [Zizania palustris]|uniref:Uncharacterized protein n=1 Tax=Zizania palustris TaxID=103762 RepID=A0A8J5SH38_ZIZPA|nr:hypothetical protein GUJ93_ZPchr0002g24927 [Zizania palustris]
MPRSATAAAAAVMVQSPRPRLHSLLSFGGGDDALAASDNDGRVPASEEDGSGASFDFAFAPPLSADQAPADDLFAHGRIVPAYPVFDRRLLLDRYSDSDEGDEADAQEKDTSTAAALSVDNCCTWVPRSAPGSPGRVDRFPKSASTGESRRWRLRDIVGAAGRSRSDGKDKFAFLQPAAASKLSSTHDAKTTTPPPPPPQQKQSTVKKSTNKSVTSMDMATAHKLFYGTVGAGGDRRPRQPSFLPYRPAIGGFFAVGRSPHHPAYQPKPNH